MRSTCVAAVTLSTLMLFQTTATVAREGCVTAETKESLHHVIVALAGAGAVILLVKEGGRSEKIGEGLAHLDEIWKYAAPLVEVCPPANRRYNEKSELIVRPLKPLYEQVPRNPDWPDTCMGRLPPALCSSTPLGNPPR